MSAKINKHILAVELAFFKIHSRFRHRMYQMSVGKSQGLMKNMNYVTLILVW